MWASPNPSPEFLLVAACCAWPLDETRLQSIRDAAQEGLDWERFARITARHRVEGLVNNALTQANIDPPAAIKNEINARASDQLRHNLDMAGEAVRLQRLFADADVPVLFLKGLTLAHLAFGNLGLRHSKDIDLLIAPANIEAASALLRDAGYRRHQPDPRITEAQIRSLRGLRKDLGYVHEANGFEVELHWRAFDNPHMLGGISVSSAQRAVSIASGVSLPTLGEDDLFAYLCAHGANDGWFRLKWLADIGALMGRAGGSEIMRLYEVAKLRGVGPAAAQALLLCQRLLATELPEPLLRQLQSDNRGLWLERIGLWAMRTGDEKIALPEVPFGGTRILLSHFLLGSGWRYKMREIRMALTSTTDMAVLPLPAQLTFLYPLLRLPLWAIRRLTGRAH